MYLFALFGIFCTHAWFSIPPSPLRRDCGNNYRIKICNAVNKFFNIAYIITQLEPKVSLNTYSDHYKNPTKSAWIEVFEILSWKSYKNLTLNLIYARKSFVLGTKKSIDLPSFWNFKVFMVINASNYIMLLLVNVLWTIYLYQRTYSKSFRKHVH